MNNFYRHDLFTGFCELINGIIVIMSIIILYACHSPNGRRYNHEASYWAVLIGVVIAVLDLVKVLRMVNDNGSVDICEMCIIITSIMIVWEHCKEKEYPIVSVLNVAIATEILETLRDIFTAGFYAKDGNGCPFA